MEFWSTILDEQESTKNGVEQESNHNSERYLSLGLFFQVKSIVNSWLEQKSLHGSATVALKISRAVLLLNMA